MSALFKGDPDEIGIIHQSFTESDVPIVVQQTRLDTRQAAAALLATVACSE